MMGSKRVLIAVSVESQIEVLEQTQTDLLKKEK